MQDFGHAVAGAEVALFYYSGHGLQVQGVNWLVPIDANPTRPQDLDFQMVDADLVLRQMDGAGTKLNLVLLDACRNNPFGNRGLRALQPGLAEMRAPEGTLISYATQPGNVAMDGAGANSPYTTALAASMRRPGLDVFRMFNQVGLQVKRSTGGNQQPWVSNSPIDGDFYFVPPDRGAMHRRAPAAAPGGHHARQRLRTPVSRPPPAPKQQLALAPPPQPASPPSLAPVDIARETVRTSALLGARRAHGRPRRSRSAASPAAAPRGTRCVAALDGSFGTQKRPPALRLDVEMLPSFACRAIDALAPAIRRARANDVPRSDDAAPA